eukprot:9500736-Pyramimonas_sp.AAC.1
MKPLLLALCAETAHIRFLPLEMRSAVGRFIKYYKTRYDIDINTTTFNNFDFSRTIGYQILNALAHLRALLRKTYRYGQLVKRLSFSEKNELDSFLMEALGASGALQMYHPH